MEYGREFSIAVLAALLIGTCTAKTDDRDAAPGYPWYEGNSKSSFRICLYLFWHNDCECCKSAKEFAADLQKRLPFCKVVTFDLHKADNMSLHDMMAMGLGQKADSCPAFFFCNSSRVGFTTYEASGKPIEEEMQRWYDLLLRR